MFTVDYIIITVLSLIVIFEGLIIFYALRRINAYEQIFTELIGIIDYIKNQMNILDAKGTYRSDDEVGFFWEAIKNMSDILTGLFEEEEQDAQENNQKEK